jgi:parallel beta-helix repeat protein
VIAAGNNTRDAETGAYQVDNTIFYFEPGKHIVQNGMYTGDNSVYIGGYTAGAGPAVIDGVNGATVSGLGGSNLSGSRPGVVNANQTWEYLTIRNYSSSQNDAVLGDENGGGFDAGNTYKYDTIGPNEYGYRGDHVAPGTGESSGGGYAIGIGSNTTIEDNCLTRNAQGAYNGGGINDVISNNEISRNGLGEYPDTAGPGGSPYSCGCSGGGKLFFTVNAVVTGNYVHDNYNAGIWLDFDNTGATISDNYIASNWGTGISYEASYNASITDNTLTGNGWASDGSWPAGTDGRPCFGGVGCTNGIGPITGAGGGFPFAAIDLSNSGGNSNLKSIAIPRSTPIDGCASDCTVNSNYNGELLVKDNVLVNNFGGVLVYTDTNRYPGNVDDDSACSVPLGSMNQSNNTTYYQQTKELQTAASDAVISGSSVTSPAGTIAFCDDYGDTRANEGGGGGQSNVAQAPSVGMAVFDMNSGKLLGNVARVTSAHAFTLSRSPGNESRAKLLLSAYGGCGPADYYGSSLGTRSGKPAAHYWDNCIWGSRNIIISGNTFSAKANVITGCTAKNMCGYMMSMAFNAGVPKLMQFFDAYPDLIANASDGLGNVWSDNTYSWTGNGPRRWQFMAGDQGNQVTQEQWTSAPYSQDRGSVFNG